MKVALPAALADFDILSFYGESPPDARKEAIGALDTTLMMVWWPLTHEPIRELGSFLEWGDRRNRMCAPKKVRPILDIDSLVARWRDTLVALSTAHGHAERTAADHDTDDLLGPLLTAPIAQVREFAAKLSAALEADDRVPFLVWSSFQRVALPLIQKGPDGGIVRLRHELAMQVAEAAAERIDPADWVRAMAGALMWRPKEQLEEVKEAIGKGARPRVTGRYSCLFLTAVGPEGEQVAQVVL